MDKGFVKPPRFSGNRLSILDRFSRFLGSRLGRCLRFRSLFFSQALVHNSHQGNTTIIINSDSLGHGDAGLGGQLMLKGLHQLAIQAQKPSTIVFYNAGVRLLVPGSPLLDVLKRLEGEGVDLIACGTCMDFFQLRTSIAAGRIGDMREILTMLSASDKVITL